MAAKKHEGGALPPLQDVVSALSPRKTALGRLDVKLVDALKSVEQKLHEHLPTRVSVVIETSQEESMQWFESLTFGKWDGKWQLVLESGEASDPETWKTQPLASASREKRVSVFTDGHVEKLVRTAAAQLDAQIAEREKAIAIAGDLIGALEGVDEDL